MVKKKFNNAYIQNSKARFSSFTKRKSGLFSKARELSTISGSNVLIICESESNNFYWQATGHLSSELEHISSVVIERNRRPTSIIHGEKRGDEKTPGNLTNPLSVRQKRRLKKILRETQGTEGPRNSSSASASSSEQFEASSSSDDTPEVFFDTPDHSPFLTIDSNNKAIPYHRKSSSDSSNTDPLLTDMFRLASLQQSSMDSPPSVDVLDPSHLQALVQSKPEELSELFNMQYAEEDEDTNSESDDRSGSRSSGDR